MSTVHPPKNERILTIFVPKVQYDRWVANINKSKGGYSYIYHICPICGSCPPIKRRIQFHTNGISLWCKGFKNNTWSAVVSL